jgi:hypothetical protein
VKSPKASTAKPAVEGSNTRAAAPSTPAAAKSPQNQSKATPTKTPKAQAKQGHPTPAKSSAAAAAAAPPTNPFWNGKKTLYFLSAVHISNPLPASLLTKQSINTVLQRLGA